ncbi:hypothetical protein Acr_23g0013170 [Actinidia rufa]|uniref:Uncharacterized protein n=1 Tax=Actinidia rufa TaxID=165716 RepID=A0A7J0GQ63_9ERIC|nr:hypothetical protein Acr_23g0013170 [Actinidia rufa]
MAMSRSDERRRRVCAEDSIGVEDITKLARLLLPDLRSGRQRHAFGDASPFLRRPRLPLSPLLR